jgi:drug/metabolite transporter (DMT)-like permease
MELTDIILLCLLSAIWGSSFMFMRYLSPIVGPVLTADMRLLIAGIFLVVVFLIIRFKPEWRKNWKHFLSIGVINSAVPFLLFSFAALSLPASLEVIFNSLSPMFGAIFSAIWLNDRLTPRKICGLLLGISGVLLIAGLDRLAASPAAVLAIAACLLATVCYGLAGIYVKKRAKDVKPLALAGGSQLLAGLLLFPFIALSPPRNGVSSRTALIIVVFALLCSAIAYVIYYRLISRVGPTRALTVTFLMPVFGMLWGALFLNEEITLGMIGGVVTILSGTFLVVAPSRAVHHVRT